MLGVTSAAQSFAYSIIDEKAKNEALTILVKYYSRVNDLDHVKKLINDISDETKKNIAILYVLDSYIRQKDYSDYVKLALSIKDFDFLEAALSILELEQGYFYLAKKNMTSNESYRDAILNNFIEMLLSVNEFEKAEEIFDLYKDEMENEVKLYLVHIYLKNKDIDSAKKIKDEISDSIEKWIAAKLIERH